MEYREGEFRTPVGRDALSGTVARRMSGVDLVDAEKPRRPRQAATPGGGSLLAYKG